MKRKLSSLGSESDLENSSSNDDGAKSSKQPLSLRRQLHAEANKKLREKKKERLLELSEEKEVISIENEKKKIENMKELKQIRNIQKDINACVVYVGKDPKTASLPSVVSHLSCNLSSVDDSSMRLSELKSLCESSPSLFFENFLLNTTRANEKGCKDCENYIESVPDLPYFSHDIVSIVCPVLFKGKNVKSVNTATALLQTRENENNYKVKCFDPYTNKSYDLNVKKNTNLDSLDLLAAASTETVPNVFKKFSDEEILILEPLNEKGSKLFDFFPQQNYQYKNLFLQGEFYLTEIEANIICRGNYLKWLEEGERPLSSKRNVEVLYSMSQAISCSKSESSTLYRTHLPVLMGCVSLQLKDATLCSVFHSAPCSYIIKTFTGTEVIDEKISPLQFREKLNVHISAFVTKLKSKLKK